MGFADISIVELAEDYNLPIERIFELCKHFGIPYQDQHSQLALEDAKRIILTVLDTVESA
ncbi:MAG: hypothetical protein H7Y22_14160 [Gemmatimonadaceae bacterium]|nr:hypothetical protein [Gloeobacterales cyanobacterium ES-bin-141]